MTDSKASDLGRASARGLAPSHRQPATVSRDHSSGPRRLLRRPVGALVLAGALAVAGCSLAASDPPSGRDTSATAGGAPGLRELYGQELSWSPCGDGAECADVAVPLDYDRPGGRRISLALKRVPSDGGRAAAGSLLVNFGGPGAPGTALVEAFAAGTPALKEAYDLVGFDPRGVGESTAVDCVDDAGMDALRASSFDLRTREGVRAAAAQAKEFGHRCARRTGPLLGEVDTVSAARDLDIVRAVLDEEHLSYLGYSYGTLLGATYADLFPERTGRLVLDGAVDPTMTYTERTEAQAAGFESSIRAYARACLSGQACPLTGSVDHAVGQVRALLERLQDRPLPTKDGRKLTPNLAGTGILVALYDDQLWPVLTSALTKALQTGDGSELAFLADVIAGRQPDGSYTGNLAEAQAAITCLDNPMDSRPDTMAASAARLARISPTFGHLLGYSELRCKAWPYAPVASPGPLTARGAAPILVIGTTKDPATPYAWSRSLAGQLESGHLLTYRGYGHTAYGRGNGCLHDAVNAFLLDGVLPEAGLRC